ncbi:hypothetical protein AAT19DRAFT_11098 [Rhodotorula toruloides]|uniref:Uncharacterized protein n=1 Tax=Rhodotorula toruloides TaxID=5286 RepID=A0A2S9ZX61_RHOTO|nr:hypothetical protein AAT19DRAFT_11098 [Rhodotorula toruloides]
MVVEVFQQPMDMLVLALLHSTLYSAPPFAISTRPSHSSSLSQRILLRLFTLINSARTLSPSPTQTHSHCGTLTRKLPSSRDVTSTTSPSTTILLA